jgi:hypothetical protein
MRDRQTEKVVPSALKSAGDAAPAGVKSERNGKRFRVLEVRDGTSSAGRSRAGQRRMGRWDPPPELFPS